MKPDSARIAENGWENPWIIANPGNSRVKFIQETDAKAGRLCIVPIQRGGKLGLRGGGKDNAHQR